MRRNILPEFQDFLISRQLVPGKDVPIYAIWVGKFLSFLNLNRNIKKKSTLPTFIGQIKNHGNVKDWQLKQAEEAVKLYKEHFLGDAVPSGKHVVDIREIQGLLGHKSLETTMIYTHVLRNMANSPQSPLDSLYSSKTQ